MEIMRNVEVERWKNALFAKRGKKPVFIYIHLLSVRTANRKSSIQVPMSLNTNTL